MTVLKQLTPLDLLINLHQLHYQHQSQNHLMLYRYQRPGSQKDSAELCHTHLFHQAKEYYQMPHLKLFHLVCHFLIFRTLLIFQIPQILQNHQIRALVFHLFYQTPAILCNLSFPIAYSTVNCP